ncbi:MAG TPA: hypothetical protein VEW42_04930 [Candidatus Eisenbacteria bacterium]|nr:hypothetical protein [Candidatus Eisenbacteria bacterium]
MVRIFVLNRTERFGASAEALEAAETTARENAASAWSRSSRNYRRAQPGLSSYRMHVRNAEVERGNAQFYERRARALHRGKRAPGLLRKIGLF